MLLIVEIILLYGVAIIVVWRMDPAVAVSLW
jgi:hypothetical protein